MAEKTQFSAFIDGNQFALTTVFDAYIYEFDTTNYDPLGEKGAKKYFTAPTGTSDENFKCTLDTLKVSNINAEGPTLTITGGRNDDTLLKSGKKYRIEMQDALGNLKALAAFGYGEIIGNNFYVTNKFGADLTIIGTTQMIDKDSGDLVDCEIVIPRFKPDSITNLAMDAGGDATVFDLNGDISSVQINTTGGVKDVFYYFQEKGTTTPSGQ